MTGTILVISELYWPCGGAELATHLILRILKSSNPNIKINVLTGSKNPERIAGIHYIYSSILNVPTKLHLWKNLILLNRVDWFNHLIKKADIVYIPRVAYPVIPLAKKYDKKVVVHLHNYQPIEFQSMILHPYNGIRRTRVFDIMRYSLKLEVLEYGDLRRALASSLASPLNTLCKSWLLQADDVICVSKRQAEIIVREIPDLSSKMRVLYNPLPNVPFGKKQLSKGSSATILYLGGDSYIKGFHIFLRVSQRLLEQGLNVKFLLARRFSNKSRLLVEKLNKRLKGSYHLLGHIKHEKLLKIHLISRALLFPSISEEPFPYVILEAMLSGTIPIASSVGGIPEIVQGTYAEKMLFTLGNVDELVDRMEHVLSLSKEQLTDIGVSLREAVLKRFDEGNIKKQLSKVFGWQ